MTTIIFERSCGDAPYWFTFWPRGELRGFIDTASAEAFARRQGLTPVFKADSEATDWDVGAAAEIPAAEPGRIEYRFLGVTGEEDA